MRPKPNEERRTAIYARVSTNEQRTDSQVHELKQYAAQRGWAVHKVYTDEGISGATDCRPALDQLLADAQKRKFDIVLVWRFDRFARSVNKLVSALALFKALQIDFCSRCEAVDTSLPMGQLVFHVFAAIAQFERELVRARTVAGVQAARRRGKKLRRPAVAVSAEQVVRIRRERSEKSLSIRKLARKYGLSSSRVHLICRGAKGSV